MYEATKKTMNDRPPLSARNLQLVGLSLGYATAVLVAEQLLRELVFRHDVIRDVEAQAFVLRMVDCMQLAARSLKTEITLGEEVTFASFDSARTFWCLSRIRRNVYRLAAYKMDCCSDDADVPGTWLGGSNRESRTKHPSRQNKLARRRSGARPEALRPAVVRQAGGVRAVVQILFRVSLRVVLLRGARGAALDGAQAGAQAGLPRNYGRAAGCG